MNAGGIPTQQEQIALNKLYRNINYIFYRHSGMVEKTKNLPSNPYDKFMEVERYCWQNGWGKNYVDFISSMTNCPLPYHLEAFTFEKATPENRSIYLERLYANIQQVADKNKVICFSEDWLPKVQSLKIMNFDSNSLLRDIINTFLNEAYSGTEFASARKEYPQIVEKILSEQMGNTWENSKEQHYLNSLLTMLRSPKGKFDIDDINGDNATVLKSFAAFCQRGDTIDKLTNHLITKGIGQLGFAYAMWGSIFGFADMPKTLTNNLFELSDSQYVKLVYNEIHFQLFGKQIENLVLPEHNTVPSPTSMPKASRITHEQPMVKTRQEHAQTLPNTLNIKDTNTPWTEEKVRTKIKNVIKKDEGKENQIVDIYQGNNRHIDENFFNQIKKINRIGDKTVIKLKEQFGYPIDTNNTKRNKSKNKTYSSAPQIPGMEETEIFFIRNLKCCRYFKNNNQAIDRIIDNWKFACRKNNDKEERIKHFVNLCKQEGRGENKKYDTLKYLFTEEIGEQFKQEMMAKYDQYYDNNR